METFLMEVRQLKISRNHVLTPQRCFGKTLRKASHTEPNTEFEWSFIIICHWCCETCWRANCTCCQSIVLSLSRCLVPCGRHRCGGNSTSHATSAIIHISFVSLVQRRLWFAETQAAPSKPTPCLKYHCTHICSISKSRTYRGPNELLLVLLRCGISRAL